MSTFRMTRWSCLALVLVLVPVCFFSTPALARGALYGWAERGGYNALSSLNGAPISIQRGCPAATITVRTAGTLTSATIYSDSGGTAKSNPFTATGAGFWHFYANDGDYDVLVSCGAVYSYTLRSLRVLSGVGSTSIMAFGALCDGTTDDTAAIQAAIDSSIAAQPTTIQIPADTCKFVSQLLIDTDRTRLAGVGSYASTLLFVPESGGISAFKVQHATASTVISNISFSGFRIYSSETTLQKIAFDIVDGSFVTFTDIAVGPEEKWIGGGNSIGIKLRGREFITIRDSSIWANDGNALSVQPNPNNPIDADYLLIENSVFSGDKTTNSTKPIINILSDVQISRSTFKGINMSFGSDGIYQVDGASATSSFSFDLSQIHWEQPKSVAGAGYLLKIDKTGASAMLQLSCHQCGTGGSVNPQNGVYVRNIEQITLDHLLFSATSGTSVNASAVSGLTIRNSFVQSGSSKTMTNMRRAKCVGRNTITAIDTCVEELWVRTDNGNLKDSLVLWDVSLYTETGTLANGASVALFMGGGGLKTSRVEVFARGATIRAGGTAILDNQGAALVSTGLLFDDADTGSNLCVIWGSSSAATLKNNTGESLDYAYTQWFRR